ncbi:MAG TPA: lysophospholipid acyltransferase family protein [Verrucomicrobiae bacterium]|nr:lysophospholipid acyltransferase family protein [Verrucomicrobiae bacterium]
MPEKGKWMTGEKTRRKIYERKSGVVVPEQPKLRQRIGAWIIVSIARLLTATLRYKWNDHSGFWENPPDSPLIFAFWHNRILLCPNAYRIYSRRRKRSKVAAIASTSRDGAFLSAILKCFGIQPVRGSSHMRGPQALLELTSWAQQGYDIAMAPDGPRGPCYHCYDGVISLAQLTGHPIIPFGFYAPKKFVIKSWDRFQIPKPFSVCEMNSDKPIYVPRQISDAEREALRKQLEDTLNKISRD